MTSRLCIVIGIVGLSVPVSALVSVIGPWAWALAFGTGLSCFAPSLFQSRPYQASIPSAGE